MYSKYDNRNIAFDFGVNYTCPVCNKEKEKTHENWISCGSESGREVIHKQICRRCFEKRCKAVTKKVHYEVVNNIRLCKNHNYRMDDYIE